MEKYLKILTLLFFIGGLLIFPRLTFAEEIKSFDSKIVAHQDGTMDITETIIYDYGNPDVDKHGIFRIIPKIAKVGDLYRVMQISPISIKRDGINEDFTDSSNQEELNLKIGNPDRHIKGVHTFEISYKVQNGIGSNYADHDEIFWNITGNDWQVPILKATAEISADFGVMPNKAVCYTGTQDQVLQGCSILKNSQFSAENLSSNEGFSVVVGFPKGTFPESILLYMIPKSKSSDFVKISPLVAKIIAFAIILIPVFLNFILAPILLIWYFKNKNKKRFGPISVNFDFPEDEKGKRITPAEAGTIDNAVLDQNDAIATIFDFAIRKLIRIEQIKDKKVLGIFGGGDDYKYIKLKELTDGNSFENELWNRLFKDGDSVEISSLKQDFYETFSTLSDEIFNILVERKFYSKNPKMQRGLFLTGAIISFVTLNLILGGVLIFFYKKLIGRTNLGDEMDFKIDGLKLFLKNMSREHTWQAKNLITVEKYIPYAIALGYIKEFMEELKVIYPNYHPGWYSGQNSFYIGSMGMYSSMSTTFTTHAAASSSGFSGGGFSGGGGGGGGGGSW